MLNAPLIVLFGASGLGKTSLVGTATSEEYFGSSLGLHCRPPVIEICGLHGLLAIAGDDVPYRNLSPRIGILPEARFRPTFGLPTNRAQRCR
jgi:hypothetical protein